MEVDGSSVEVSTNVKDVLDDSCKVDSGISDRLVASSGSAFVIYTYEKNVSENGSSVPIVMLSMMQKTNVSYK